MTIETMDRRNEERLRMRETALKRDINEDQIHTLATLERFGWTLKFVRRSPLGPLAAVYDPEKRILAIIEPDGSLNENPPMAFRP